MASKPKRSPTSGRKTNLDASLDTGGTIGAPSRVSGQSMGVNLEVESVDPAFSPEPKGFLWQDVPPGLKTATIVVFSAISIIVSGVWYLSKLDSNVDVLKTNLGEVKIRTEELVRTSIQHGEKLDTLEKSVDAINAKEKHDFTTK